MAFRLSTTALQKAIKHICRYGDTDVFPHLLELAFFRDEITNIVDELGQIDLDVYSPSVAIEALAPKGRFSFRITHQLGAVDTVLLLAAVIEIGEQIDGLLPPSSGVEAFSYRFDTSSTDSVFLKGHTYKDWLDAQRSQISDSSAIKHVVATDISDFYARISFHRLENLLNEAAPGHGAVSYIKKAIKVIRVRQSFGLPVGGAAARLLAELALSDTDKALIDRGITATRFVDDFRIFLTADESPYGVLSFLAQHLSINEGLALNASKTSVVSRSQSLKRLKRHTRDITATAEAEALESLAASLYFEETPDAEDLEKLKALNLIGYLEDELSQELYDTGRIRVIFRALRITKPTEAIEYIEKNFANLAVFSKEVTLLMQVLEEDSPSCFDNLSEDAISAILEHSAANVQVIRTWLLELFVRGVIPINSSQIRRVENLSSVLDKRQIYMIKGRLKDWNFFRSHKAKIGQMPAFERVGFICGAACLPKDEYETWLKFVKSITEGPTVKLFLKWVEVKRDVLRRGELHQIVEKNLP
ncbi:MAG: reverse transcriptase domain-containing protein [Bryobacterales bacterium]|nr:reverse transcriptase domain-containing protein [Bryobacterales bacterium]